LIRRRCSPSASGCGGYLTSDLTAFFTHAGISPGPKVSSSSVDGATNSPSSSDPTVNYAVTLDIDVAGSVATDANIVVYFAPWTEQGLIDAITTAV
jgi:kumamolisin